MSTRRARGKDLKEGIKHIIEERWDLTEEKTLHKMRTRECLEEKEFKTCCNTPRHSLRSFHADTTTMLSATFKSMMREKYALWCINNLT